MTDSLITPKSSDGFTTESPIRAFTDFQVSGSYAIGKGFRPSLGHLARYLDAMQAKEGWGFLQIILPDNDAGDPTILFEKALPSFEALGLPSFAPGSPATMDEVFSLMSARKPTFYPELTHGTVGDLARKAAKTSKPAMREFIKRKAGCDDLAELLTKPDLYERTVVFALDIIEGRTVYDNDAVLTYLHPNAGPDAVVVEPKADDPLKPKHYDGWACAEIIEYMPTNVGLAVKYLWRLGEKDPEQQERGKAIVYLKRELALRNQTIAPQPVFGLGSVTDGRWFQDMASERVYARDMPFWRKDVIYDLIAYTIRGGLGYLITAMRKIETCGGDDNCADIGRGTSA